MRKLFLLLVLLAFGVNALAQETTVSEIEPVGVTTESNIATSTVDIEKKPTFYVNKVLKPFVNAYLGAMAGDGWRLDGFLENDFIVMFDFEIGRNLAKDEVAGLALGMNNDEAVYVIVSVEAWVALEDFGRQDLISHELMHDMYNVEHVSTGENNLMDTESFPKSWADTFYRLVKAIKNLNEANGY